MNDNLLLVFKELPIVHRMGKLKDDEESLLPMVNDKDKEEPSTNKNDYFFKGYVIFSMTILWTAFTLTVRFTRSTTPKDKLYSATTVVLLAEFLKLIITIFMIFKEGNYSVGKLHRTLSKYFFGAPKEVLKMSVPSIAYALQNNLDFVALSNLDAGVYQVTTQLKVVTTALFMMAFLGRKFSPTRWMAILMLFMGVACVQMNAVNTEKTADPSKENYILGIFSVLATCVTAGFAGVYFEKMLKDGGSTPFWVRNLQMYSCGVISASIGCFITERDTVFKHGFFYGYNDKVYSIVAFLSVGGLYISLVMKHLDNLHKSFASAVSIILVVLLSLFLFDGVSIGIYFVIGTITVCSAILLYNSVPE